MKQFKDNEILIWIGKKEELLAVKEDHNINWHGCTAVKFDDEKKNLWLCPEDKTAQTGSKQLLVDTLKWYYKVNTGRDLPEEVEDFLK